MVEPGRHDLYALFAFAVREYDWALADLIATYLLDQAQVRRRLERELVAARRDGARPKSVKLLRHWATIAGALGEAGD